MDCLEVGPTDENKQTWSKISANARVMLRVRRMSGEVQGKMDGLREEVGYKDVLHVRNT